MQTVVTGRISEYPVGLRARMRDLSLGPIPYGFWSWTFQDGSSWASLCFDGPESDEDKLVGWAALTLEVDILPVVGVFVQESHRGRGVAGQLVTALLQNLLGLGILERGDSVYNSTWRWSKYTKVIEGCGLRALPWK